MKMLGALLALYREAAGYTQKSLGEQFGVSEQQIASIEQGRRPLKPDPAEGIDEFLDTKGALSTALSRMPEVDLVPMWAEEYLDREREAIVISWYESLLVPGLLQTEAYARAVFRNRVPVYDEDEGRAVGCGAHRAARGPGESTQNCPGSRCRSCRWGAPRTPGWKARSSCWRRLSTSGSRTAKHSAAAP
nr:Scr1 family TA system antitoxin-like transcriptional regulator [Streptomyces sp. TRM70350]